MLFISYIKVAFRNMWKQKFYALINIIGLALGLTVCTMIGMYVADEFSYDEFHSDVENLYRVGLHGKLAGQEIRSYTTCPPLANGMLTEIPGIEKVTRVNNYNNIVFRYDDLVFTEEKIIDADSTFFDVFGFKLLKGDPQQVLVKPNSMVITESLAKKYLGDEEPIGKIIQVGNSKLAFEVTGLAEDPPSNSHIEFEAILSMSSNEKSYNSTEWLNNYLYTYFVKHPEADTETIAELLEPITIRNVEPQLQQFTGMDFSKLREGGGEYRYNAHPITDTRLYNDLEHDMTPAGNIQHVYILIAVGLFILIIACINFMNLATARSAGRAKEVGMRKTLGSHRGQLILQFLSESVVYAFLATLVALILAVAFLPGFNTLSGKELSLEFFYEPQVILGILVIILLTGVLAGSYPAFYLTSFNPVEVLKGKVKGGVKSKSVRSALVVFQFALSIMMVISTAVVFQQISFMRDKNIGIDKHNVLIVKSSHRLNDQKPAFKKQVQGMGQVQAASFTNNSFPGVNSNTIFRSAGLDQDHIMGLYYTDHDHQEVLKFEMAEGRFFSEEFPSDSTAAVINEAAVRELGWTNPLEEHIIHFQGEAPQKMKVIGVIKDFNYESFKSEVRPLVILTGAWGAHLHVRYEGDPQSLIQSIEQEWKGIAPGEPFEYTFLDDEFDKLFRAEERLGKIFTVFTILTLVIATLGLFALASFTSEQRTREIGIRKVLGASDFDLVRLLSFEFTKLVLIAIVIAVVPAYFIMSDWLNGFNYRIELSWGVFVISCVLAILVAWITVGLQALKAARLNPSHALRYE